MKNKLDSLFFNHKFVPKRHKFEPQMKKCLYVALTSSQANLRIYAPDGAVS